MPPSILLALGLILSLLSPATAWAHGRHLHAQRSAAGPFAVEQLDWGIPGNPRRLQRTWLLELDDDEKLEPAALSIPLGSTVRLVIRNRGSRPHELVLASPAGLESLAQARRQSGKALEDSVHIIQLAPGDTEEVVWEFNRPGPLQIRCIDPAHAGKARPGHIQIRPRP